MKRPPPLFFAEKIIYASTIQAGSQGGVEGFDWNPLNELTSIT